MPLKGSEYIWGSTPVRCSPLLLVHPPDKSVDLVLPVACITSLYKVGGLLLHASTGRGQFEWPEEVAGGLEVLSNSVDLVDEILNADDAITTWRDINEFA